MSDRPLVHVVDDDAAVRRSLDFLLATANFSVRSWQNGESFLAHADRNRPACVVLDMRLPGADGLEVLQRMVERSLDWPTIVLTGHGDIGAAVRAMQLGATDFLEKPVDREQLLRSLEQCFALIENHKKRAEYGRWARGEIGKLTERELETLDGLACGYPNKTIAYDLGISSRTVEVYRANIMSKLDVVSFAAALRIAFAAGLGSLRKWKDRHPHPSNRNHAIRSVGAPVEQTDVVRPSVPTATGE